MRMRRGPSKWKGLVTTPTVSMPRSRAMRAMTGAAPVPVPPPMPAVMNTMWAPSRCSMISSGASSAAARPTSGLRAGAEALGEVRAELDAALGARVHQLPARRCWRRRIPRPAGSSAIMLLTALVPPPPTPITVIRGVKSVCGRWEGEVQGHAGISSGDPSVGSCLRRSPASRHTGIVVRGLPARLIRRAPQPIDRSGGAGRSAVRSPGCGSGSGRPSPAHQVSRPAAAAKAGPGGRSGRPRDAHAAGRAAPARRAPGRPARARRPAGWRRR